MIKIITDSSSYFKKNEAVSLGIRIVPLNYTVDNRTFTESYSDKNGNYATLLKSCTESSTAQANTAVFLSCFEEELAQGHEILCITISSRLSGTFSSAHTAAKQTESDKIAVVDSHLSSGGLNILVREALKLVEAGKSLEEIQEILMQIREKIKITFTVDDLDPLRRSGRIHFMRMGVSSILNVRPILKLEDGGVVYDSTVHGRVERIRALANTVSDTAKEVVINYIENKDLAITLYNVIKEKYPDLNIRVEKMGPVLGVHIALQAVSISVYGD